MNIPENLRYTKEHEWVQIDNDIAVVGITEYATSELGDIVFIELPDLEKRVSAGESLCVVESTKAASDIYAPLGGVVKEINENLSTNPENINENPYEKGWIARLKDFQSEDINSLLSAEEYKALIGA